MRKRIAKDLPKLAVQLRKILEKWEDEYGRPFLVHGERYLDELETSEVKPVPGPRSRTPAPTTLTTTTTTTVKTKTGPPSRANSTVKAAPSRAGAKTPVPGGTGKRNPMPNSVSVASARMTSPSKIPSRAPLSHLNNGNNSPERRVARSEAIQDNRGKMAPPPRVSYHPHRIKTHLIPYRLHHQRCGIFLYLHLHLLPHLSLTTALKVSHQVAAAFAMFPQKMSTMTGIQNSQ